MKLINRREFTRREREENGNRSTDTIKKGPRDFKVIYLAEMETTIQLIRKYLTPNSEEIN